MKSTLELVHDLQALLSGPEKWTQRRMARDASGRGCLSLDQDACCWCFYGGVHRVGFGASKGMAVELAYQAGIPDSQSVIDWNDDPSRTFADIVSLMAKMEELAREEAA